MSVGLLALCVILAMIAGLVVGRVAHRSLPGEVGGREHRPSVRERARSAATSTAFRLWKWRRNRDKS